MYRSQHLRPASLATSSLGLGSSDVGLSPPDTARTAAQQNAIRREELELQMISLQVRCAITDLQPTEVYSHT